MVGSASKTAAAAQPKAAEAPPREALSLQEKFIKLREAVPSISQKQHSDGVKYKFAKIFDVYELLPPAMNQYGVNFDIVAEKATRHAENGDEVYYHTYQQQTRNGARIVWVYEADITIRWTNADDPEDKLEVTLHAIGTNDGGPDKAKGSAWTYCLKYYLFEKFGIDQGDDDPDMNDHGSEAPPPPQNRPTAPQNGAGGRNTQPSGQTAPRVKIPCRSRKTPRTGTRALHGPYLTRSSPACTEKVRTPGSRRRRSMRKSPRATGSKIRTI